MRKKAYLALDFGASNGRAYLGWLKGGRVETQEIHRFHNGAVPVDGHLYWDVLRLYTETLLAMRKASAQARIVGIGIDSWAHDYGLLDEQDELIGPVYHYRDPRSQGMRERAFGIMGQKELYQRTGNQFLPHNTLFQMLGDSRLQRARLFLMVPDLLAFWLCGEKACEYTNTTTTQLTRAGLPEWDTELMERFGLPAAIFPRIVRPGTPLGRVRKWIAEDTGVDAPVFSVGTHDTASAIAAIPARPGEPFQYISSGTWSLAGTETDRPVVSEEAMRFGFTNEAGVGGKNRLLKNITGMWILEGMRQEWGDTNPDALMEQVRLERPLVSFIDPDDPAFYRPRSMSAAVREFLRETSQEIPQTNAGLARCVLESIAMKYRTVLVEELGQITGNAGRVYLVGGGVYNRQMCRFAGTALGTTVYAASAESTALGNLLTQMMAAGELSGLDEARGAARASISIDYYEPQEQSRWREAFEMRYNKWEGRS